MTTLLYVDDEETIGRAVSRWFSKRGHTVHLAPALAAAKRMIVDHDPDIVFIDVWLGADSGFELMSWIEDSRPALAERVVFVTGELADSASGAKVWRTLGRPVLQKPFEFAQLERYVAEAERRSNGRQGTGAEKRSGP